MGSGASTTASSRCLSASECEEQLSSYISAQQQQTGLSQKLLSLHLLNLHIRACQKNQFLSVTDNEMMQLNAMLSDDQQQGSTARVNEFASGLPEYITALQKASLLNKDQHSEQEQQHDGEKLKDVSGDGESLVISENKEDEKDDDKHDDKHDDDVKENNAGTGVFGVSISFMKHFIEENAIPEDMTTGQVVSDYIVPHTKDDECTYVKKLQNSSPQKPWVCEFKIDYPKLDNRHSSEYLNDKPRQHCFFLSHTWGMPFHHLLALAHVKMKNHFTSMCFIPEEELYENISFFWIDVFCKNQHIPAPAMDEFQTAMTCSEGVVVAMWPAQPIALQRVWCLFEIMTAINMKKDMKYAFLESDADALVKLVASKSVPPVKVEDAKATFMSDVELIMSLIKETIGVNEMNEELTNSVRSAVHNQVAYRDPTPACFDGDGQVLMGDGTLKPVHSVKLGDTVMTHLHQQAVVTLVTTDDVPSGQMEMCHMNGVWLTPEHPVLCADGTWRCPQEVVSPCMHSIKTLYNFELQRGHGSVLINNLACMTLGQEIGFEPESDKLFGWGWWEVGSARDQRVMV